MLSAGMKHKVHDDVLLVILYMRPVLPVSIRPLTRQKQVTGGAREGTTCTCTEVASQLPCLALSCVDSCLLKAVEGRVVSDPERCWRRGAGRDQCPGRWGGEEGNCM